MKGFQKYGLVAAIILLVSLPVIIRITGRNHFRYDAVRHSRASASGTNLITAADAGNLPGNKLLVILAPGEPIFQLKEAEKVNIEPGELLAGSHMKQLTRHKGPIILYSDKSSIAGRVYMVLAQMGIGNLYILAEGDNTEAEK
jgi:hypothetical protein